MKVIFPILLFVALLTTRSHSAERFGYFELRIYDVTSNKLDAVQERFRETVEPVRRTHGITTLGYWTAQTTNGAKFVYLMAAASREGLQRKEEEFTADLRFKNGFAASNQKHGKTVDRSVALPLNADAAATFDFARAKSPRVFDLRIYSVLTGKLDAFRRRWAEHAVPIYARHGLQSVGWWVAAKKDSVGNEQFVCLLAGDSADAIQKSVAAFHKDAEWQGVEKETERDGKLRAGVEALKLTPTDFSPLR